MKNTVFTGIATALITPLNEKGVDYEKLERLINWQIDEGIDAIVACGTTGESSTLSDEEHRNVISFAVKCAAGRIPIIAGTGSNETAYAVSMSEHACDAGADAVLVVTPYYNKATQKGLIKHYTMIADAIDKPVILYNVPARTGVNIEPTTYAALADHPNIAAIKEANGNISKIVETAALVGDKLDIYSGNDDQVVPILAMGGKGCISVTSNLLPKKVTEMTKRFFAGDVAGAAKIQCELHNINTALFSEVNPIPVKAAMAALGFCDNYLRLPLTEMDEGKFQVLLNCMREQGLNV